jgi:hypothetical protein
MVRIKITNDDVQKEENKTHKDVNSNKLNNEKIIAKKTGDQENL